MSNRERRRDIPESIEAALAARQSLAGVRERLVEVVDAWDLELTTVLHGGWNSLVVLARADSRPVILKLPPKPEAVVAETAALNWWGDEIAPRVFRHDSHLGALLLERLEPGTELPWTCADDTALVMPVFRAMHRPVSGATLPLPSLSDLAPTFLESLERNLAEKRALVDIAVVDQARALLASLVITPRASAVVLHGDAVPANVLLANRQWRVIDPRAALGEPTYDAAYWAIFSGYGYDARNNIALIARELSLDQHRILCWAWGLAVNRLLQIVDSTYPAHGPLVKRLQEFIDDTRLEAVAS